MIIYVGNLMNVIVDGGQGAHSSSSPGLLNSLFLFKTFFINVFNFGVLLPPPCPPLPSFSTLHWCSVLWQLHHHQSYFTTPEVSLFLETCHRYHCHVRLLSWPRHPTRRCRACSVTASCGSRYLAWTCYWFCHTPPSGFSFWPVKLQPARCLHLHWLDWRPRRLPTAMKSAGRAEG